MFIWVWICDIYVIDLRNLKWCMSDWDVVFGTLSMESQQRSSNFTDNLSHID